MTKLVKEWLHPEVSVEKAEAFLAVCEADARRIDLATAEFSTHYRADNDPYCIYARLPEVYQIALPTDFVRDPANGVELNVWIGDLPEEMLEAAFSKQREQELVRQYGGYKNITPEAWAKWDADNEAHRAWIRRTK